MIPEIECFDIDPRREDFQLSSLQAYIHLVEVFSSLLTMALAEVFTSIEFGMVDGQSVYKQHIWHQCIVFHLLSGGASREAMLAEF